MEFFKKLIQRYLETVKAEREGMLKMLAVCEEGSLRYDRLNLGKAVLDFRIVVLETFL